MPQVAVENSPLPKANYSICVLDPLVYYHAPCHHQLIIPSLLFIFNIPSSSSILSLQKHGWFSFYLKKKISISWPYIVSTLLPVSFNLFEKNHLPLLPLFPLISQPPTFLHPKTKPSLVLPSMLRFSALPLLHVETALLKMISDFVITKPSGYFYLRSPVGHTLICLCWRGLREKA